jgi:FixJ family two-component response regulator
VEQKAMSVDSVPDAIVYVVDDDEQVRESLRLLAHSVHLNVETFGTAQDFLKHYRSAAPGCLVLDVCLPGMNGVELLEWLREHQVEIPTIVITAYGEISLAVRAMKSGALGFVEKPFSRQDMIDHIHQGIATDAARHAQAAQRDEAQARLATLSVREREIMSLFFAGHNTKKVASRLGISPKTVDYHRWNLLKKMDVRSMVELAHYVATHTT